MQTGAGSNAQTAKIPVTNKHWYFEVRDSSLSHFSKLGFRTFGCGYYDTDDISNDSTWVESLDKTPGAMGLMYTTWLRKYDLLEEWGDMMSAHVVPQEVVESWKKYPF